MSYNSMEKNYAPDQTHKTKMIKLIKNKLTPLSEAQKFPMGKNSFLSFKNLQKMPKIKRQHFSFKTRKSQHQEAIMNQLMTKQLYKSDEQLSNQVYNKPSSWLNIWKKMGDSLQKTYLTKRQKNECPPFFRQSNKNFQQSLTTRRDKYERHSHFIRNTEQVLQKVQKYKLKKLQQIEKLKRQKSIHKQNRNSLINTKQAQLNESIEDQGNIQSPNGKPKQNQKNINNDWVFFITKVILDKHVNKTDQQLFFQQFIKRKQQNKLKQFIQEFKNDKRIHRSCHIRQASQESEAAQRLKQQKYLKKNQENNKIKNISPFQQKRTQLLTYNNPSLRLRKLKSKCKTIIDPNMGQNEQKQNVTPYNCNKLRINSNHKKIIQTTKNLGKV